MSATPDIPHSALTALANARFASVTLRTFADRLLLKRDNFIPVWIVGYEEAGYSAFRAYDHSGTCVIAGHDRLLAYPNGDLCNPVTLELMDKCKDLVTWAVDPDKCTDATTYMCINSGLLIVPKITTYTKLLNHMYPEVWGVSLVQQVETPVVRVETPVVRVEPLIVTTAFTNHAITSADVLIERLHEIKRHTDEMAKEREAIIAEIHSRLVDV